MKTSDLKKLSLDELVLLQQEVKKQIASHEDEIRERRVQGKQKEIKALRQRFGSLSTEHDKLVGEHDPERIRLVFDIVPSVEGYLDQSNTSFDALFTYSLEGKVVGEMPDEQATFINDAASFAFETVTCEDGLEILAPKIARKLFAFQKKWSKFLEDVVAAGLEFEDVCPEDE